MLSGGQHQGLGQADRDTQHPMQGLELESGSQDSGSLKGMVHLILKLNLKVVFLSMKYNGAISFGHNVCFLTQSAF